MGQQASGLVFVGCMFLGGGIGALFGAPGAGWLIGMWAGFLGMALIRKWTGRNKQDRGA